jgi:DnaJ family protein A protein 2
MTETKRVEFYLERGKLPGEKIILQNEGDESPDFSSPGDLHIMIELTPHPTFTLRPSINASSPASLSTTLSLTFAESLLGFSRLILIHLDGRGIRVNQPAPGQPGWRCLTTNDWVMVRAEGMWKSGMLGDLWIKIEVEMPDARWASKLDAKSLETLSELLPPKRMDVDNPVETDEVEFVKTNGVPPVRSHSSFSLFLRSPLTYVSMDI